VLRIIEEEAMKESTVRVVARVPVDVGTYLLNEKRELLLSLETRHGVSVMLIPSPALETPNYDIQRVRGEELRGIPAERSYQMVHEEPEAEAIQAAMTSAMPMGLEAPAVKAVAPSTPAPEHIFVETADDKIPEKVKKPGLFNRLISSLFGAGETPERPASQPVEQSTSRRSPQPREHGKGSHPRGGTGRGGQPRGRRRGGNQNRQASGGQSPRRENAPKEDRIQPVQPPVPEQEQIGIPVTPDSADDHSGSLPESGRMERSQGRGPSRRGRRSGRHRPSGQKRNNDNPPERSAAAQRTDAGQGPGGTTNSDAPTQPPAPLSPPSGEHGRSAPHATEKQVAVTGSPNPPPAKDSSVSAQKKADTASSAAGSTMAEAERKSSDGPPANAYAAEKAEIKIDKASP
jgi:ribonuclease E